MLGDVMPSVAAIQVLLLIIVANGTPVIARRLLGTRLRHPIDGGRRLGDGRPVLGTSKTWAGLAASVAATALLGLLAGLPFALGAGIGLAAMTGDLLSSFTKRRLGLPPSGNALGLDQIPESLLPALAVAGPLSLTAAEVGGISVAFLVSERVLSRLLFRFGIRKTPY